MNEAWWGKVAREKIAGWEKLGLLGDACTRTCTLL